MDVWDNCKKLSHHQHVVLFSIFAELYVYVEVYLDHSLGKAGFHSEHHIHKICMGPVFLYPYGSWPGESCNRPCSRISRRCLFLPPLTMHKRCC